MANEKIKQNYKNIANAIRAKTGENGTMSAEDMPIKITEGLAKKPEGTLSITENGEYDVADKADVNVNVAGITPTGTKSITANGNGIDVTEFASVDVNVPGYPEPAGTKYIYNNGDNIDVKNYAYANVDVPSILSEFDRQNPLHKNCANISYEYNSDESELQLNIDVGAIYGLLTFDIYAVDPETGDITEAALYPTSESGIDWSEIKEYGLYLPIILPEQGEGSSDVEISLTCHNFISYFEYGPEGETITDEMVSGYLSAHDEQVEVYIRDALGNTIGTVDITQNMHRSS